MRDRYLSVVATIATSVTIACSDAAVDSVTAPPIAATPASPVANQFPTVTEVLLSTPSNAVGMQIQSRAFFEDGYRSFAVTADIHFQWANEASATVSAWLINKAGVTVNQGSTGFTFTRFEVPVMRGDTTVFLRISTNNTTCGLVGKNSYRGAVAVKAINQNYLTITLWGQTIEPTNGPDATQPACPPPPDECEGPVTRVISGATGILASTAGDCEDAPAPPGGGSDPIEVCYTVWREYWYYDYLTRRNILIGRWPIGTVCYMQ